MCVYVCVCVCMCVCVRAVCVCARAGCWLAEGTERGQCAHLSTSLEWLPAPSAQR